jgi:transposase
MTLVNKNWLKNEIFRAFISGESQEAIASQLKVSVGTVNSLIKEILKSDDTADLQRQIAIEAKKQGVSLEQIVANLRYKNLIKLNMLDERKSEKFLNVIDTLQQIQHTSF